LSDSSVYKTKGFARFQKKAGIADSDLWKAVKAAHRGLVDADFLSRTLVPTMMHFLLAAEIDLYQDDLGGGVIKQRIAREGEGKSGGSRSIILFRRGSRAVYVYGFEKKDRANSKTDELEAFRELATILLSCTDTEMTREVLAGSLLQVQVPEEEKIGEDLSQ